MAQRGSLPWLVLLSVLTVVVGGLLWMILDETVAVWTAQEAWDAPGQMETDEVAPDIAAGQRTLASMWAFAPVLMLLAIVMSALIHVRRTT